MARTFSVEEHHTEEVLEHLAEYDGLEHVRARRRADLLTLESGPKDDVVPHTRFRRVGVRRLAESRCPLIGSEWDRTSLRGQLAESVELVVTQFPWMLAPRR